MSIFIKHYHTNLEHSAQAMGSGTLQVLSTPSLVAFMENAALSAIEDKISNQETSVGTRMEINHLAASKIGNTIKVVVIEISNNGRQFLFTIEAYDDNKLIGTAKHTRVKVDIDRFLAKVN